MTKKTELKPKKWFLNEYFGRITLRKVNGWDQVYQKSIGAYYFDTWDEAHAELTKRAELRLKKAKAELPAAQRNIQRVAALKQPNSNLSEPRKL